MSRDEAEKWIRAHVEAAGASELVHERPWASVRRVPLADGIALLKTCAPVQAFEPRLTVALASRRRDLLTEVLAHDEERGWLLLRDAGAPLGVGGDPAPWLELLPRYAELQRGEVAHAGEHLAGGVPDRRLARFPELYEELLARAPLLAGENATRLRAFAPRFAVLRAELAAGGVAETIQHDDLHGANVYAHERRLRILDWGDSCVSHPFLSFHVTRVHLELRRGDPWVARLRDAYLEPWSGQAELRETFEPAERLAPFAHAFKHLPLLDVVPEPEWPGSMPGLAATVDECAAAAVG